MKKEVNFFFFFITMISHEGLGNKNKNRKKKKKKDAKKTQYVNQSRDRPGQRKDR
jgi:hypothetical protein